MEWKLDKPLAVDGEAFGVILLGPSGAESAIEVPVRLHNVIGSVETVSVPAKQDARIFGGQPSAPFGAAKFLHVGADDVNRSVLQFDLMGIDPANTIYSAKLRLWIDAFGGGGSPASLAAYRCHDGLD